MNLRADGVTHQFGGSPAVLQAISVEIQAGECVALMGANGAGKTTLLRILAGLLHPTAGSVTLDGQPITTMDRRTCAQAISVVPQAHAPALGFNALEFVLMGFHAKMGRLTLDGANQVAAARAALDQMGVGEFAERSMGQLSGGEAQRVVMARTLVSNANIWLLDEPTASLDMRHQLALLDTVRQHCAEGGVALAIMHDANLVSRYFDRVIVLSESSIVADGAPRDALNSDLFRAAFGVHMQFVGTAESGAWVPYLDPVPHSDVEHRDVEGA